MAAAARQQLSLPEPMRPGRQLHEPSVRQRPSAVVPARRRPSAPRVVATRRHGTLADGPQAMVRATAGIRTNDRHLVVVPEPRGRRFAGVAVVASIVLGCAMLGAAAFQTQLAQRQVQLDQLDSDIETGRQQYEMLRRQRSELRSPARLGEVAAVNGMVSANDSEVMQISSDVLALVVASTGGLDRMVLGDGRSTLDDFREVKATTSSAAAP